MNTIDLMKQEIQALPKVWSVDIQVNQTGYFDHYYQLSPHTMRVIVEGGKKKKIAKIVWFYKPIGVRLVGNTKVSVKTEFSGFKYDVDLEVV